MKGSVALAAGCALLLIPVSVLAQTDAPRVRRLLSLLHGVEQEYREAFDDQGVLVRPIELEEAAMLLTEARDIAQAIAADVPDVSERVTTLSQALEGRAPVAVVAATCREIRETIVGATGITEEVFPSVPPSASSGAVLYGEHCLSCHGVSGAGDGVDAARLKRRPPDFTDAAFMRVETPADFFLVISLGRRGGEMPEWEDVLSVQERWDLVAYLWFLRSDPVAIAAGQGRFLTGCAPCHMPGALATDTGSAADSRVVPLNDLPTMAGKTDAAIENALRASPGHRAIATMDDAARGKVIAFVRTLSLGVPADGAGGESAPVDQRERFLHALARVEERLAAAVSAYRLQEDEAGALAMNAYLAFEPLEPRIAASDPSSVGRVEAEFVRLHKAIRQPESLKEVEAAASAVTRALAALKDDVNPAVHTQERWLLVLVFAAFLGVALLVWRRS